MRLKYLLPSAFIALGLFLSTPASAQNFSILTNLPGCNFQTGQLQARCIPIFVAHLIGIVFSLISILFLINVMFAGYQIALGYIRGEKAEGIERLRWSILGLIISVCAFLILDLVVSVISP